MAGDKELLIDMGFPEKVVLKALLKSKNSGIQPALDWIEKNPDDDGTLEEEDQEEEEITQETAQSLKCDDCGKLLKDATAAEIHAIKTGHSNFSESTMAIKPLTAEEKAEKLKQMTERLAQRREEKRLAEIKENKERETVRRTTGAEMQLMKEKLEREQMAKEVEDRRRQKEQDRIAKENVKRQLEADKRERQLQAEERKRIAAGQAPAPKPISPASSTTNIVKEYTESRIQIRVTGGPPLTKVFASTDTLKEVYDFAKESIPGDFKLLQTFPRKVLDGAALTQTLKELGLCPSAALVAQ